MPNAISPIIIAGIVQIILGFIKAGVFGDYIPTNVIKGIQPITKYRKKTFKTDLSQKLVSKLNEVVSVTLS